MTSQAVNCPQCDAPMVLAARQQHCQCAHCGSKYVVDRPDAESPQLTRFESILEKGLDEESLQRTEERLTELESAIPEAEDELLASRTLLEEAKSAFRARQAEAQSVITPPQNRTYLAGLLALVAWFLVWFVVEDIKWYAFLAIAALLLFLTWALHQKWRAAKLWAQSQLRDARQDIEQAVRHLTEVSSRLVDYTLERELHEMQVSSYREASQASSD